MIKTLKLSHFRKVLDATMDFGPGLNVIRGVNEASKSTRFEAILYALYGTRALRNSLAETVTWGHKESALSVELTLCINGVDHMVKRSKAGAQATSAGVLVTGQVEVSAYAGELLGADAATASQLMLASQNSLRGALDSGPAAISGLMGKLANFDLIDRLLENAHQTWSLGPPERWLLQRDEAVKTMQDWQTRQPNPLALQAKQDEEAALQAFLVQNQAMLSQQLQPAFDTACDALAHAQDHNEQRQRWVDQQRTAQQTVCTQQERLQQAQQEAAQHPSAEQLAKLQQDLELAQAHDERAKAYARFKALPTFPEMVWEGDKAGYVQALQMAGAKVQQHIARSREIKAEIKGLQGGLITRDRCPTCGQKAVSDDHVSQVNNGITAKIEAAQQRWAVEQRLQIEAEEEFRNVQGVESNAYAQALTPALLSAMAPYTSLDESTYPPALHWAAAVPTHATHGLHVEAASTDVQLCVMRYEGAKKQEQQATQAQGRVMAYTQALKEASEHAQALGAKAQAMPVKDLEPLLVAKDQAFQMFDALHRQVAAQQRELNPLQQEIAALKKDACDYQLLMDLTQAKVVELDEQIKTLNFNNALVKKLRTFKPLITDHLWNTVLAAVSHFFTQLRGQLSVVTKDADGFKVNGNSLFSLSGSTLDVLALAIRVALTKTLIPHASFLVLDEPFAACDMNRTGGGLGFLAAVGFDQVLMASHDPMSDSVADHVIAIGELSCTEP